MSTHILRPALFALLLTTASGCALTGKSDALDVRYFTPEAAKARLTSADASAAPAAKSPYSLRLGRITSGKHLRDRIVYRENAWELGFYEDKRWTENPEVYVRHELTEKVFERNGIARALGGGAPVLDVELLAFDEVRTGPSRAGRVTMKIVLHDGENVLVEDTISVDRPITGKDAAGTVAAIAEALGAAGDAAAERVVAALRASPR